jgi:PKD repeat protein
MDMSIAKEVGVQVKSWIKTTLGAVAGLCTGAVVMWFSPLVDRVIKPGRPIANFSAEVNGFAALFQNRSANATQARWDFGDGSPLEFLPGDHSTANHIYAKPGSYTVKLTAINLIGEENERTVTVEVGEPAKPKVSETPQILDLAIRPASTPANPILAPATVTFTATAENGQLYLWDFGDGQGIQMGQNRQTWTFEKAGQYRVKLTVFNGSAKSEYETLVAIADAPRNALNIEMRVADEGTAIETTTRHVVANQPLYLAKPGPRPLTTLQATINARPGFEIVEFKPSYAKNQNVTDVTYTLAPDKRSIRVVGKIAATTYPLTAVLHEPLELVERRTRRETRPVETYFTTVPTPGTSTVRLAGGSEEWTNVKRKFEFLVKANDRPVWQGTTLPKNVPVQVGGQVFKLNAVQEGDRIELRVGSELATR